MLPAVHLAPMEGVTSVVYRRLHHAFFPGIDAYFTPFFTPTAEHRLTPRQRRDLDPDANAGVPTVPQVLTRNADDLLWAAHTLADLGYTQLDLNLGCPSGTVTAKGKGAGLLAYPDALDRLLDRVCASCPIALSVKTRLGMHDPDEFAALVPIYNRYPLKLLTIHARVRQDFYKGAVRADAFAHYLPQLTVPVSYNGDLFTAREARTCADTYPTLSAMMIGRGLLANPALVTQLRGGAPADRATLTAFFTALYDGFTESFGQRRLAMLRMKEIWSYHAYLFEDSDRLLKALRKATNTDAFEQAAYAILSDLPIRSHAVAGWYRPA